MTDSPSNQADQFESVDWSEMDPTDTTDRRTSRLIGGVLLLVGGVFTYDYLTKSGLPVVDLTGLDWLLLFSVSVLSALVVLPIVEQPEQASRYWARLSEDTLAQLGVGFLALFFSVGILGPAFFEEPQLRILYPSQPPVWGSINADFVPACWGRVVDGRCYGTWKFPLGTVPFNGRGLLVLLILGFRTAVTIAVGAAAIIVPTGLAVGLTAATMGGRVDAGLMWLSELLQTLPAILVYFLFFWWMVEGRLLLLTVVIGLVSWGGMARLVRNEALQRSNDLYVRAAEGAGASRERIIWRHVLPNIAPTVITAVTLQVPLFVLVEASVSFVQVATTGGAVTLGDPTNYSWGQVIYIGLLDAVSPASWWVGGIPLVVLMLTVFAFNVVGNGLADALDPQ